jgi:RHS repeat-associated protein
VRPFERSFVLVSRVAACVLAALLLAGPLPAPAQGTCGAAGGAPAGPSSSVCRYASEAAGLPLTGPAAGAGNPVDLVTGNKYRHELDLRLPGPVDLVFARHYNGLGRHAGPLGVGWSHSFETRLAPVRAGGRDTVQVVQGDGRRRVFERDPARPSRWRTHEPADGTIARDGAVDGHGWRWRWPGGRTLRFDANGRLRAIERDGDVVLRLFHDEAGRLVSVNATLERAVFLEYVVHPQGARLASVSVPQRTIARFAYDDAGQLASVEWLDGRRRTYAYDDPHDPLRLTAVDDVDADGTRREVARYAYDAQGRTVRTVEADGRELRIDHAPPARAGEPGLTTVVDAAGRVARYRWTYDRHRHVARLIEADGEPCASCPPAPARHRRDARGRLSALVADGVAIEIARDALGRPVAASRLREGGGARTSLWRAGWHRDGLDLAWLEQPSVAPGRTHRIDVERDARGRVVAVAERGFAPVPPSTPETGARRDARTDWAPIARRFEMGHRAATDRPAPAGALTGLAWVDGPEPGPADRIAITHVPDGLTLAHPAGLVERLRYEEGLLVEHFGPGGRHVRMRRDVDVDHWLGGPTLVGAFADNRSIDFERDPDGTLRAVSMSDFGTGWTVRATVDGAPAAPASTLRALRFWRDLPTEIALPDGTRYRRGFDDFGRVAWIDEPSAPRQWARHDATDRLIEHRPGDGTVLRYRRDAAGRLVEAVREGPRGRTLLGRYRWDGPQLVEAANDTVTIRYEYDAFGRLAALEHAFAALREPPLRWRWHRDLAGRIAVEELPGGYLARYAWDGQDVVGIVVEGLTDGPFRIDPAALRDPLALRPPIETDWPPAAPVFEGGRLVESGGARHLQDPHGRRASRRAIDPLRGARDGWFAHHDWRLRAERRASGRLRLWLWAGHRPVAAIDDGVPSRIVTDPRGAPVRVIGRDGREPWAARYSRTGEAQPETGSGGGYALRLPGQLADERSVLHHNHWRTYDPRAGRYLERDPLGLQPHWTDAGSATAYADGDPIGGSDPWGLATVTFQAVTTGADGRPLGRAQGFDRARWSFLIEHIEPVPLVGDGSTRPEPSGIGSLLFDPWGDFVGARAASGFAGNGFDTLASPAASGRALFAAFAAHYGGALASVDRLVIEGFDDRRAGALALILSASPSARAACVDAVLGSLPAVSAGAFESPLRPTAIDPGGTPRLLSCAPASTLAVPYRDALERARVERFQAAAELQESPSASINASCTANRGCRSNTRIDVNGRSYWASYGRTQFTVTTFLAELMRMTARGGDADARALAAAIGLDDRIVLAGRDATVADALALARRRVDAAYRAFAALRRDFGTGVDRARATATWDALPDARRAAFEQETGLGVEAFVDMLGFVPDAASGRTEEEGRHALAAAAAATVGWTAPRTAAPVRFDAWLVELFASREPYDHVSRAFLRDNLRRVLEAPSLAGRFDNAEPPGTDAWRIRQRGIELDLARRVAVLHNAGRLDLATRPDLQAWLDANSRLWVSQYARQFVTDDARGNWEALRCASGLAPGTGLQLARLEAMPARPTPRPGPSRRLLAQ